MFVLYSTAAHSTSSSLAIDSKFRWFIRSIVSSLFRDSLPYCHTPPLHKFFSNKSPRWLEETSRPESGTSSTYSGGVNFLKVYAIYYTLGALGLKRSGSCLEDIGKFVQKLWLNTTFLFFFFFSSLCSTLSSLSIKLKSSFEWSLNIVHYTPATRGHPLLGDDCRQGDLGETNEWIRNENQIRCTVKVVVVLLYKSYSILCPQGVDRWAGRGRKPHSPLYLNTIKRFNFIFLNN